MEKGADAWFPGFRAVLFQINLSCYDEKGWQISKSPAKGLALKTRAAKRSYKGPWG